MSLDLGTVNGSAVYFDTIGSSNSLDVYNFSRPVGGNLSLTLEGVTGRVDLELRGEANNIIYTASVIPEAPATLDLDTLPAGDYSLQVLAAGTDTNYQLTVTVNDQTDPITGLEIDSGFFVVDQTGEVGVDFIYDGSAATGELAIFSLRGMENLEPGSELFVQEAARRALTQSDLGYVVISDAIEGAKLSGGLGTEQDWNEGEYQGGKTFSMQPGDVFALMLVPNGTVKNIFDNPIALSETPAGSGNRPLFSLISHAADSPFQNPQITSLNQDGTAIVIEEQPVGVGFNRDQNDLIVKLTGVSGRVVSFAELISPDRDWRDSELGQEILSAATSRVTTPIPFPPLPDIPFPTVSPVIIGPLVGNESPTNVKSTPETTPEILTEDIDIPTVEALAITNLEEETTQLTDEKPLGNITSVPEPQEYDDVQTSETVDLGNTSPIRSATQINPLNSPSPISTENSATGLPPSESRWKGSEIPFDPKMLIDPNTLTYFEVPAPPEAPANPEPPLNPQPIVAPASPSNFTPPELTPRSDDMKVPGEPLPMIEPNTESESNQPENSDVEIQRQRNSSLDSENLIAPQELEASPTPTPAPRRQSQPILEHDGPVLELEQPSNPDELINPQQPEPLEPKTQSQLSPTSLPPLHKALETKITDLALLFGKVWWTQVTNLQNLFFSRSWHLPGSQTPGLEISQVPDAQLLDVGTVVLDQETDQG